MDLGASAYTSYVGDLPSFCALTASLGMSRIELRNFIGTDEHVDDLPTAPLASALRDAGLASTIHAPWRLNLAASDEAERANALLHYSRAADIAAALGSDLVVFHGGWTEPGGNPDEYLDRSRASIRSLLRHAATVGTTFALENDEVSRPTLFRTPSDFVALGLDDLRYVLDVGHAHTLDFTAADFLDVFDQRLIEVHLHDNGGDGDTHLPVGDGTIAWNQVSELLAPYPHLVYVLECKSIPCLGRSLAALRRWFDLDTER